MVSLYELIRMEKNIEIYAIPFMVSANQSQWVNIQNECKTWERYKNLFKRKELLYTVECYGRTMWKKWAVIIVEIRLKLGCTLSNY